MHLLQEGQFVNERSGAPPLRAAGRARAAAIPFRHRPAVRSRAPAAHNFCWRVHYKGASAIQENTRGHHKLLPRVTSRSLVNKIRAGYNFEHRFKTKRNKGVYRHWRGHSRNIETRIASRRVGKRRESYKFKTRLQQIKKYCCVVPVFTNTVQIILIL